MMIELLIFQRQSVFQLSCLLEIQGLAESGVCPTSWCLFLLDGGAGPSTITGEAHQGSWPAHLCALSDARWVSRTRFDAEGEEASRRQQSRTLSKHMCLCCLCPGVSTLVACDIFLQPTLRSQGHNKPLTCLLPFPHLH